MKTKQYGFHVIELTLVLLVVGIVGFVGYRVMQHSDTEKSVGQSESAPKIKTASDLTTADTTVDELDTTSDDAEMTQLETDLNSLDSAY